MNEYIATYIIQFNDMSQFHGSTLVQAISYSDAVTKIVERVKEESPKIKRVVVDRIKITDSTLAKMGLYEVSKKDGA